MAFLAYIINQKGTVMDDSKVELVIPLAVSEIFNKLHRFLGFAYFYR